MSSYIRTLMAIHDVVVGSIYIKSYYKDNIKIKIQLSHNKSQTINNKKE